MYYCTCLDEKYLLKGITLIRSLLRHTGDFTLFVACLDDNAFEILKKADFPHVALVRVQDMEARYPELLIARGNRGVGQYAWTTKPYLMEYLFSYLPEGAPLAWVDTDLFFFSSAHALMDELGDASVLLHQHHHPEHRKASEKFGLFNSGMLVCRNDEDGRKVVAFWKQGCFQGVPTTLTLDANGTPLYGDQMYLNYFSNLSDKVRVTENPGVGVAPWNQDVFAIGVTEQGLPTVNGWGTVFYHFSACELFAPFCMIPMKFMDYFCTQASLRAFYIPYLKELMTTHQFLCALYEGGLSPWVSLQHAHNVALVHREALAQQEDFVRLGYSSAVPLDDDYVALVSSQLADYSPEVQAVPRTYDFPLAPIVLICFKRLDHTQKTLEALAQNTIAALCELHVFIDGPRHAEEAQDVQAVCDYVHSVAQRGCFKAVHITRREENYGCARNVIAAQRSIFEQYDRMIYLEEDIMPNAYFLEYMQEALEYHKDDKLAFFISGGAFRSEYVPIPQSYAHDTFYALTGGYGFAMWKDRWQLVDFELKDIQEFASDFFAVKAFAAAQRFALNTLLDQVHGRCNTWDIQITCAQMRQGMFCVVPRRALAVNIGNDGSGLHCPVGANPHLESTLEQWRPVDFVPHYRLDFSLILKVYLASGWLTSEEQKRLLMLSEHGWQLLPQPGE